MKNIKYAIQFAALLYVLFLWVVYGTKLSNIEQKRPVIEDVNYDLGKEEAISIKDIGREKRPFTDYQIIMWYLKGKESLHYKPYWDVKHWTHGWGTKAKGEHDYINFETSNRRVKAAFQKRFRNISRRYPHLTNWEKLVITSLKYNIGKIEEGSGLDKALSKGQMKKAASKILLYYNAGGEKNPGLVKRRKEESAMLLMNKYQRQELGERLRKKVIKKIKKAFRKEGQYLKRA